ncbi:MAG: tyrosine-type recombinase/integrase [Nitrospira sp.]
MKYRLASKPSGIILVEFSENGARRRISTHTRDVKLARERAKQIVAGCYREPTKTEVTRSQRAAGMLMEQLFDRCLRTVWSPREVRSQATVLSNVRILTQMIGTVPVSEMTYSRLEQLVRELFDRGYAAGTVARKLCTVSKALTEATKIEDDRGRLVLVGRPAIPTVTADNSRDRVVSKSEEVAIFEAVERRRTREPTRDWRRFGMCLRFLLDTGCRLGEALGVRDSDIEKRDSATFVSFRRYTTKNKKPRMLPLTDAIVASLPYLRSTAVDDRLFPLRSGTVWYMWKAIREDVSATGVNIEDVVLHTLRHTCLTRLARSGQVRLDRISDWAGHSSLQVTMDHYLHLIPEDKLDTMAVLNAI